MARGPLLFRERDATRLMRAALKAGMPVDKVTVDKDGNLVLDVLKAEANDEGGEAIAPSDTRNIVL